MRGFSFNQGVTPHETAKRLLVAAGAAVCSMPAVVDNHEDFMITVTEIGVMMGHRMEFREGMMTFKACMEEEDAEDGWSARWPVDGKLNQVTIVSRMDMWAEMFDDDRRRRGLLVDRSQRT